MAFVYDEEKLARLQVVIEEAGEGEVDYATVEALAEEFMFSTRSITAKIRALGGTPAKKGVRAKWPEVEADIMVQMMEEGATDVEIAEKLGKTVAQIRGKALSMKMLDKLVRVTKPAASKTFSDEETEIVVNMANDGSYMEDIAEATGKSVRQIRGKLLSLKMSAPQRDYKTTEKKVVYTEEVLAKVTEMVEAGNTAEQISKALELNLTGLKSKLGKLGLKTEDMVGNASKAKYTEEDLETMRSMIEDGATAEEVAAALDKSVQGIKIVAGKHKMAFVVE